MVDGQGIPTVNSPTEAFLLCACVLVWLVVAVMLFAED
jgi:hypothetical protein